MYSIELVVYLEFAKEHSDIIIITRKTNRQRSDYNSFPVVPKLGSMEARTTYGSTDLNREATGRKNM